MGQYSTRHGFTLIELLIAILIVGILATLGVWGYQEYSVRARGADIITKYDALRTGVQARASKGKTDDCAQLARDFDTQNLADQYAALAYGFEAVVGGYRPVLIVCAKATKHGVLGVKVARAAHDTLAKTGTSEPGAVLTDTLVSFALPLTSDNQPLCKMAPAQKGECAPWSVSPPGPGGSKPVPARPPAAGTVPGQAASSTPAIPNVPNPQNQNTPANTQSPPQCGPLEQAKADNSGCEPKTCPQGQQMDPSGQCFTRPTCSVIQQLSADQRTCVPKTCSPGQQLAADGQCFTPPTCAGNQQLSADQRGCVPKTCPRGQQLAANGQCFTPPTCAGNQQLSADHRSCIPTPCPLGQHRNPQGKCVGRILH